MRLFSAPFRPHRAGRRCALLCTAALLAATSVTPAALAATRADEGEVTAAATPAAPLENTELRALFTQQTGRDDPDAARAYLARERVEALASFYETRAFDPLWMRDGAPTLDAYRLIGRLEQAARDGLKPQDYALPEDLGGMVGRFDAGKAARFERALSAALVAYADHAQAGRIAPSSLSGYITAKPERPDPAKVLARLAASDDPVAALDGFNPPHAGFQALRAKLAELTRPGAQADKPAVVPGGKILKEGVRDARVAVLRDRLGLMADTTAPTEAADGSPPPAAADAGAGPAAETAAPAAETVADDMAAAEQAPDVTAVETPAVETPAVEDAAAVARTDAVDPEFFDAALKEAVLAFQRENGLHADGIVGPRTLLALNAVADDGMAVSDIVANMERWRWLPRDLGAFHVKVNIPEFKVRIVRDGEVVHETRVVVGKPSNQTPVFSDEIDHLIVNPYWNVPYSIASQELLPSIRANPTGYMARRNYEVLAGGRVVSPASVDWQSVNLRSVRIRQRPGAGNALGKIKFMFPNRHSVYLHDTPSKRLFGRSSRAFSHGCVRVQDPFDFADALLQLDPQWDKAALQRLFGPRERRVNLERPVPVHLTYFTAHVDAAGKLQRRPDIYGHNARLTKALEIEGWQAWQRFAVAAPVQRRRSPARPAATAEAAPREVLNVREQRARTFRLRQRGSNDLYR